MKIMTASLLWLIIATAGAAVYRSVDEQGRVIFSDSPAAGAERVDLPPIPTYKAPTYPASASEQQPTPALQQGYTRFSIVAPAADATLRDNTGAVPVRLELEPDLRTGAGHRIQLYLDGRPMGAPTRSLRLTLSNVDRGEHRLAAAVLDRHNKEISRTAEVRFFLHRQSINFPRGPNPRTP